MAAVSSLPLPSTSPQPRKLRVGVFADSPLQPRWAVEALAKLAASDFAHVRVVEAGSARAERASVPWRLYGALDRKVFGAEPSELVPLAEHLGTTGPDSELDVAFVLGELDDSRLDGIARYGVWRFCFGADGAHGDAFAGLREVGGRELGERLDRPARLERAVGEDADAELPRLRAGRRKGQRA